MKFESKNLKDTEKLAKKIAKNLKGGEVIAMEGDLGAGKTFFTQALAKSLGVSANVNSPTFVIMKLYKTKNPKIKNLAHIDAYRLGSGEDLFLLGAMDYFGRDDSVVIIEWASKVSEILPKNTIFLNFQIKNNKERTIQISEDF